MNSKQADFQLQYLNGKFKLIKEQLSKQNINLNFFNIQNQKVRGKSQSNQNIQQYVKNIPRVSSTKKTVKKQKSQIPENKINNPQKSNDEHKIKAKVNKIKSPSKTCYYVQQEIKEQVEQQKIKKKKKLQTPKQEKLKFLSDINKRKKQELNQKNELIDKKNQINQNLKNLDEKRKDMIKRSPRKVFKTLNVKDLDKKNSLNMKSCQNFEIVKNKHLQMKSLCQKQQRNKGSMQNLQKITEQIYQETQNNLIDDIIQDVMKQKKQKIQQKNILDVKIKQLQKIQQNKINKAIYIQRKWREFQKRQKNKKIQIQNNIKEILKSPSKQKLEIKNSNNVKIKQMVDKKVGTVDLIKKKDFQQNTQNIIKKDFQQNTQNIIKKDFQQNTEDCGTVNQLQKFPKIKELLNNEVFFKQVRIWIKVIMMNLQLIKI